MKEKKDKSQSNLKLIHAGTGVRVSQACDRCRIKKVRCDGQFPCGNCDKVGFECKTSDKLTRRAFPKGYTENLERKVQELENEVKNLRDNGAKYDKDQDQEKEKEKEKEDADDNDSKVIINKNIQINNPIDQILNIDNKGIIIGNDNLNFESQFNHLLINLNLPFLKIKNSHNYLINDPNSFLYSGNSTNTDLDLIYNPLTNNASANLPTDIYNLFVKLINNFKLIFANKNQLDCQIIQFFLNYNIFIPIFDYNQFIELYNEFHISYPFIFTYNDSSINGYNLSINYSIINKYFLLIIQIYTIIFINDESCLLNLNLVNSNFKVKNVSFELYDFLPYFNTFHISIDQLQTYLLFLYYSLLNNNKEKSLILCNLANSFIGILGINLNSKNLFFNDLSLSKIDKKIRIKNFWSFKILLKCFNLKFGYKPSLNTTIVNPVTIDKYFQLTPEKLSSLLDDDEDDLNVLLKPSIELLNLMNIIIPSSFSPNYYQYLKKKDTKKKNNPKLHWILNDDDGDGNDGNLNYNFNQFLIIDKNLVEWHQSLKTKNLNLPPLQKLNLANVANLNSNNLYLDLKNESGIINQDSLMHYYKNGLPDIYTSSQLVSVQLNFHYNLIRSQNYLNFIVDKELNFDHYLSIFELSKEVLNYFLLVFNHVGQSKQINDKPNLVMQSLGLDVDEDGFVINDFSVKRKKNNENVNTRRNTREVPDSPFNAMMNGLSLTIISLKKSILLQMVYLLICLLKFFKRDEYLLISNSLNLLNDCINLFIKIFINYKSNKTKEDEIYKKLINDEFRTDILDEDDDDEDETFYTLIDWDDEEMNEDLKYLKVLKSIQYKSANLLTKMNKEKQQQQQFPQQYTNSPIPNLNHANPHATNSAQPPQLYQRPMESALATPQYYEASSPSFGNYKIPSMTKLDFLLSEDHFRQYNSNNPQQEDIIKKEKLVINDLMNMKNNQWNNFDQTSK